MPNPFFPILRVQGNVLSLLRRILYSSPTAGIFNSKCCKTNNEQYKKEITISTLLKVAFKKKNPGALAGSNGRACESSSWG